MVATAAPGKLRPIPFTSAMVLAILANRKSQTRRLMNPQPSPEWSPEVWTEIHGYDRLGNLDPDRVLGNGYCDDDGVEGYASRYGSPGDLLWVKEPLQPSSPSGLVAYQTTGLHPLPRRDGAAVPWPWKPAKLGAMYCPRWASRLVLEVTEIRVERLQDISEADAIAEGVHSDGSWSPDDGWLDYVNLAKDGEGFPCETARDSFRTLWESINGPGSWDANPWVWVVGFKRVPA